MRGYKTTTTTATTTTAATSQIHQQNSLTTKKEEEDETFYNLRHFHREMRPTTWGWAFSLFGPRGRHLHLKSQII